MHTESDLRIYFSWCIDHGLNLMEARRVDIEVYMRWSQKMRRRPYGLKFQDRQVEYYVRRRIARGCAVSRW